MCINMRSGEVVQQISCFCLVGADVRMEKVLCGDKA